MFKFNLKKGDVFEVDSLRFIEFNRTDFSFNRDPIGFEKLRLRTLRRGKFVALLSELSPNSCSKVGYRVNNLSLTELYLFFSDNNKFKEFKVLDDKEEFRDLDHKSTDELKKLVELEVCALY